MSSRDERAAINCLVGASPMDDAPISSSRSVIARAMYALLESLYDNTWSSRVTTERGSAMEIGIDLSADRRRLILPPHRKNKHNKLKFHQSFPKLLHCIRSNHNGRKETN
jgi:hypothetical protein